MVIEQVVNIIDDDESVRDSINELVSSVGLTARVYAGASEFLTDFSVQHAGCLVLDIRMARMSGLALQKKLNELGATIPVIFITGYGDVPTVVEAMKAGAIDFIQKPYHEQGLLDSINNALEYDRAQRTNASGHADIKEKMDALTRREREIMDLLSEGNNTKQIAQLLAISPRTVEVHRQRVLSKLDLNSVSEIINLNVTSIINHS